MIARSEEQGTGNKAPSLPLSGVRILDFTLIWAGPYGVMLLSDMGAEVIRIESCQHHITNTRGFIPKPTRQLIPQLGSLVKLYAALDPGERPWDRHALFNGIGRNRYGMTADLRRSEGQAIIRELVKVSDVLIENNSVGLLDSWGLGYRELRALNPTLVYVTMPIFGLSGPYADYMGFGSNAEAISGLNSLRGYRDGDPTTSGHTNHMDAVSGIGVAYATLMALYERQRTGRGQFVEFDQLEHMLHQLGGPLMDAAMNGRARAPLGNRDPVRAPQGIYPCRPQPGPPGPGHDRWVALTVGTDREWAGLCQAMGSPAMAGDPRYRTALLRQARHDDLDAAIARWTSGLDAAEATAMLQRHGVPASVVATDRDVFEDPHLDTRGFFVWMGHPECGRHRYPGHPFKYSGTPLRFDSAAPCLGQHNDLVYRQLLGLPPGEIARLTELGHIGDAYTEEAIRGG